MKFASKGDALPLLHAVRRNLVGGIINLLREAAEFVDVRTENDVSPDPTDNAFCACAEQGHAAFIATLNRKDFPQENLVAKGISPGDRASSSCDSVLAIRRARTARSYTFDFAALGIEALSIPFHIGIIFTSAADGGHPS
jgi:hypothetical protein